MSDLYIKAIASGGGASRSTATLMKTGQTTSFRTGDDGDLQAGRNVDFFTLAENNPFGNTNRFTDTLGGSTYANDIVIDWSTYDSTAGTVLGYTKNYYGVITDWNTCVDNALSLSLGSYTSGWRLSNIKELINLFNYSLSPSVINYPPFNFPNTINLASSTTYSLNTSFIYISYLNSGQITPQSKTAGTWYIAVRTFTVTGTILS